MFLPMSRSPPVVKETIFLPALEPSNITSRVSAPGAAASLRVTRENIMTRDTWKYRDTWQHHNMWQYRDTQVTRDTWRVTWGPPPPGWSHLGPGSWGTAVCWTWSGLKHSHVSLAPWWPHLVTSLQWQWPHYCDLSTSRTCVVLPGDHRPGVGGQTQTVEGVCQSVLGHLERHPATNQRWALWSRDPLSANGSSPVDHAGLTAVNSSWRRYQWEWIFLAPHFTHYCRLCTMKTYDDVLCSFIITHKTTCRYPTTWNEWVSSVLWRYSGTLNIRIKTSQITF